MELSIKTIRNRIIFSAVFAALVAVSGFIIIPLPGGIPLVIKNLFVVLSGTVLGSFYGGISLLIFIGAGLLGAPVFIIPGPGAFSTPLGGYIIGYFIGSLIAGIICGLPNINEKKIKISFVIRLSLASFSGFALILLCGTLYMMRLNSLSFSAAFMAGIIPYIPGDLIKLVISIPLVLKLRPIAARYIN